MPNHRRPEIPYTDAARGTCRWCGEAILHESGKHCGDVNRRRRWHPACADEYNLSDPREARRAVRKRDRGRCQTCKLDTYQLGRDVKGRGRTPKLRELGFKPRRSLWELDHIVPLVDGGGHDLDNMQTLCVPCHERKTSHEARERARARRAGDPPTADTASLAKKPSRRTSGSRNPRRKDAAAKIDLDGLLQNADATNQRVSQALAGLESDRS